MASPPHYLRDCLESTTQQHLFGPLLSAFVYTMSDTFLSAHLALISSEDPMRVELSLRAAENLVRKNTFAAREVSQQQCENRYLLCVTPSSLKTLDDVCFSDQCATHQSPSSHGE